MLIVWRHWPTLVSCLIGKRMTTPSCHNEYIADDDQNSESCSLCKLRKRHRPSFASNPLNYHQGPLHYVVPVEWLLALWTHIRDTRR